MERAKGGRESDAFFRSFSLRGMGGGCYLSSMTKFNLELENGTAVWIDADSAFVEGRSYDEAILVEANDLEGNPVPREILELAIESDVEHLFFMLGGVE